MPKTTHVEKPRRMVKMTLPLAVQNKYLKQLSRCFGINETFEEPHVLYVRPYDFAYFMTQIVKPNALVYDKKATDATALRKMNTISLKELNVEWVDYKKEPRTTFVTNQGLN